MNSQDILDDVGGLFLHLLNLLTKTIIFGGCRTWCNSLSKVAWLKYVENMAPVTQYDSKCQTRKTHQPSIGIIYPGHVSLSGCCKCQECNIDTKNDAFKKNSMSC